MAKAHFTWTLLFLFFITFTSFVRVGYSIEPVVVEFLYYEVCSVCPIYQDQYEIYEHNTQVIENLERDYGTKVSIERIHFYSQEGLEKRSLYGILYEDWNPIVINYERVFTGSVNETLVREFVDAYLTDSVHDVAITKVTSSSNTVEAGEAINISVTARNFGIENESFSLHTYCNESLIGTQYVEDLPPDHEFSTVFIWDTTNYTFGSYILKVEAEAVSNETKLINNLFIYGNVDVTTAFSKSLIALLIVAFTLGFFETFSPCLIILLSFVLSYTLGKASHFQEGFSKVMVFGTGFISATLLLAVALGLIFLSMPALQYFLMWVVCIFALVFGLNLLGVLKFPSKISVQTKPLIRKLASRPLINYTGLFLLGFVFYFLDPCIAPIFVSLIPLFHPEHLFITIFVFCLGAIVPFFGIAISVGSISKLARGTYKQQSRIRAVSGLILIGYAIYLIVFYLLGG